jgi:NDP-sugar pyrophosphorylase family protein
VKFFILAGGYGKRAVPLSLIKAKAVFPLNGIPLLRLLLDQLRGQQGLSGFINPFHLGAQVMRAAGTDPGVRFIFESELSGSMVLRQAIPSISQWLLVVNGDTYLEIPLPRLLECMADAKTDGALLVRADKTGEYAALRCQDGHFQDVSPPGAAPGWMYAGVALFRKRALEWIDDVNFFTSIRRHRLRFRTVVHEGLWLDFGTPESYLDSCLAYQVHIGASAANALSPGTILSPRARVERSVLWENTRLGDHVALSECIVTGDIELDHLSRQRCIISRQGIFPLR